MTKQAQEIYLSDVVAKPKPPVRAAIEDVADYPDGKTEFQPNSNINFRPGENLAG